LSEAKVIPSSKPFYQDYCTGKNSLAGYAFYDLDKLLTVKGVSASFTLVSIGNRVHISARSDGSINVQLILEQLHGGGHYDVAGAQVDGESMQDVIVRLREAINQYLDH
jgi:c-di-AMP phosphodiesterase-like protein